MRLSRGQLINIFDAMLVYFRATHENERIIIDWINLKADANWLSL